MEVDDDKVELEDESASAIKALGPLFKLTQVHFWVDLSTGLPDGCTSMQSTRTVEDGAICSSMTNGSSLPVDTEFSRQMNELGLPLSFHTNKEKRNGKVRGKRKDTHKKFLQPHEETLEEVFELSKVSECEVASHAIVHNNFNNSLCSMSMPCHSESSYCGIAVGDSELQPCCSEGEYSTTANITVSLSTDVKHSSADLISEVQLNYDQECDSVNSTVLTRDDMQIESSSDHGDCGTSSSMYMINDHGKKKQNGWLEEKLGGPVVADQRTEVDELPRESDMLVHSQLPKDTDGNYSGGNDEFGDWMTYWDPFYGRYYYYNIKTQESTWEPPPSRERLPSVDVAAGSDEIAVDMSKMDVNAEVTNDDSKKQKSGLLHKEHIASLGVAPDGFGNSVAIARCCSANVTEPLEMNTNSDESSLFVLPDALHRPNGSENTLSDEVSDERWTTEEHGGNVYCEPEKFDTEISAVSNKRKKKVKRTRSHRKLSADNEEVQFQVFMEEFSPSISKYWCQRYILFSKYDEGIKMDEEGWYSVTPEPIAKHHALRCGSGIIVDCFTGVGGNAIQFAPMSTHVIAIDINPTKIEYAKHNAAIYGVKDLIEFVRGDCYILAQKLKADTVFLSPPWGGPEYAKAKNFDLKTMLKPHDGQFLFDIAKGIAPKIVMFLPRNVDINQLAELCVSANPPWSLEVEKNLLNGKLKAITAYFSDPLLCKTSTGTL